MVIKGGAAKSHWNYFLALERDMEVLTRYVEVDARNLSTFSIELARLLFAAASEVDVLAKLICEQISPTTRCKNIDAYRACLMPAFPELPNTQVFIPRYGLDFLPWENWGNGQNPDWWRSYNLVKHRRDTHFGEATLQNALTAMGGLLIFVFHYYSRQLAPLEGGVLPPRETTEQLSPPSTLFRLRDDYYYVALVANL